MGKRFRVFFIKKSLGFRVTGLGFYKRVLAVVFQSVVVEGQGFRSDICPVVGVLMGMTVRA